MAEANKEQQTVQHENTLTFENRVLEKIANYSVKNIEGILELKGNITSGVKSLFNREDATQGVSAEVGKKEVALDIEIVAEYGKNIPHAFDQAIAQITQNVAQMTGLDVVEVNMHVSDIQTRIDYEKSRTEDQPRTEEALSLAYSNGEYLDSSRVQ